MKLIEFLLNFSVAVLVLGNSEDDEIWENYKTNFHKVYETQKEEAKRKAIFLENKKEIDRQNALFDKGMSTWQAGFNQFTDFTHQEVVDKFTGYLGKIPILETDS